jgi:hypothetical protein
VALAPVLFVLALPGLDMCLAIFRRDRNCRLTPRPPHEPLHRTGRDRFHSVPISSPRRTLSIFYIILVPFVVVGFFACYTPARVLPFLLGLFFVAILAMAGHLGLSRAWLGVAPLLGPSVELRGRVKSALALAHFLELEAVRATSADSLFEDFVPMTRKLGFTYAKLDASGTEKLWILDRMTGPVSEWRYDLGGGQLGSLTVGLHSSEAPSAARNAPSAECARPDASPASQLSPMELRILSEVAAETWFKAARQWEVNSEQ